MEGQVIGGATVDANPIRTVQLDGLIAISLNLESAMQIAKDQ